MSYNEFYKTLISKLNIQIKIKKSSKANIYIEKYKIKFKQYYMAIIY